MAAKKREPQKPADSQSESGDELEETSSEEVDSQESESEQPQGPRKASIPATQREAQVLKKASTPATQSQASAKTQQTFSSSGEEGGSNSEFESESEPDGADHMSLDYQKSKTVPPQPRSKSSAAEAATPTASKRPAEDREGEVDRDAKKAKKKADTPDESKKQLFQRLWSEDDEIAILNGMIEYSNKKKADPVADLNAFHEFIKKNLHVEVSRSQLQDKIRRLRKKYGNNKSKEKDGKNRTFSKPHEQKAYELSKIIWGGGKDGGETGLGSSKGNVSAVKKTPSADNEEAVVGNIRIGDGDKVCALDSGLSVEERIMRAGAGLFETGKGIEGEKEWKNLRVEEIELFVKQTEVKLAQSRLVLNALKST